MTGPATGPSRRERMRMPPVEVPERPPGVRRHDFAEVALGYDEAAAVAEAQRCLVCAHPTCVQGCPVGVRIDEFVAAVAAGEFDRAAAVVAEDNSLPAVCGRVCPQEVQCEGACVMARKGRAIHIGALERFVADRWARRQEARVAAESSDDEGHPSVGGPPGPVAAEPTGRRVAVVGSGPAGLACAGDLVAAGHEVVVYEALHELGGVLAYGIPRFRLPREVIDREIERLAACGVRFETDVVVGRSLTLDELLEGDGPERVDAVFIGVGAGLPRFLEIPGEHLVGVYAANEFLTRINLMGAHDPFAHTPLVPVADRRVMVFGAGNTAMDAARSAVRLGAREVVIAYRRGRDEMPARREEIRHAEDEGVILRTLVTPEEFLGDDEGHLVGVRLRGMELGEPGPDGRRRPRPRPDAVHTEPLDVAVVAIGNDPNPLLVRTVTGLERTERGTLVVDPETGATTHPRVWAGGDIVTGGATVISAMGAGRRAARAIDAHLRSTAAGR